MESIIRFAVLLFVLHTCADAYVPRFFQGRLRNGFVPPPDLRHLTRAEKMDFIKNPPNAEWFQQRLDHFNPSETRTWKQKYFQSGPASSDTMFVMIGGEGAASEFWMVTGMWIKYAKSYNAVQLQLEHRYYGESHPTEDCSVENLRYLTSEQALADLASFISAKKSEVGATKVIVVGGSYSGNLAAWFRLKYPHLADGALAASAPVLAQVNFKGYLEVVAQSLDRFKPAKSCNNAISAAVKTIEEKIQTAEGRKEVKDTFNLCDDIDMSIKNDVASLFQVLAGFFMGVVQYNNVAMGTPNITDVCKIMTDSSTPSEMDRFAQVSVDLVGGECIDYKYSNFIKELQGDSWQSPGALSGYRSWLYQTCTEFGYYQSSDSDAQPFGHNFPEEFVVQMCADIYGSKFTPKFIYGAVNASNVNYGARRYTEDRVVFTNGNIDPWHYLGIIEELPQTPVIFIDGTAHCADMYGPRPIDPPGLIKAREDITKLIGQWLK